MTLTQQQLDQLKANYAYRIVDGMDMDSLIDCACNCIEENIKQYEYEDIKEEIIDCYGEEDFKAMLTEVSK